MVINENNSFINSFNKGMNSDTAYDQFDCSQYFFGQNVRITKNQFIGTVGTNDDYASVHEGIITPVPQGLSLDIITNNEFIGNTKNIGRILSIKSIDEMVIMITAKNEDLAVYRFYIDETTNQSYVYEDDQKVFNKITKLIIFLNESIYEI